MYLLYIVLLLFVLLLDGRMFDYIGTASVYAIILSGRGKHNNI